MIWQAEPMLMVGLTGGIGAGKSAVAARLAELGAVVIDADVLAREVVAPGTDGLAEIVAEFGDGVLGPDGALDRPALAAKVFGDEPARRRLEQIIHPRVRQATAERVAAAPPEAIVVNDVPLLVEAGLAASFHLVIVVEAPRSARVERLIRDRGMTAEQAAERIAAQASEEQRRAAADVLLDNSADLESLRARVDALWERRLASYQQNLRLRRPAARPERVELAGPDPAWPAQFQRIAARLARAAGDAALRIDHVGSTAVPGLVAKDVIDIQISVADLQVADAIADQLAAAGFPPFPGEWADTPKPYAPDPALWRKRLHGAADPGRPAHVHLRAAGSPGWRLALLFRDWLRAEPAERDGYAAEKRRLAGSGLSRAAYPEAKAPWFDAALPRAEEWARRVGWQPPPG